MNNYVSVKDKMPEDGKYVIATYINDSGNRRKIIGRFVEQYSWESVNDDDEYNEYCEEDDGYYLCEGWYEQQDNWDDYGSIFVHEGDVDYWMEIPSFSEDQLREKSD